MRRIRGLGIEGALEWQTDPLKSDATQTSKGPDELAWGQ